MQSLNENIEDIRKYLNIIQKSFDDAESCLTCSESCCDIFNNLSNKILSSLADLEESVGELVNCENCSNQECTATCPFEEECPFDISDDCTNCNCNNVDAEEVNTLGLISNEGATVKPSENISFNYNSFDVLNISNNSFFEVNNNQSILIKQAGVYIFEYYVLAKRGGLTTSLFNNNVEVPFSRFISQDNSRTIQGKGIFNAESGTKVKLRNISDTNLKIEDGDLEDTISAYLYVTLVTLNQ
ncbi:MAG: hypothetical protein ACK5LV_01710 [Lachnospirales bacterium]